MKSKTAGKAELSKISIVMIPLSQINEPETPMRTSQGGIEFDELCESIKKVGLIQPITVKRDGKKYEVVAGHRRMSALRNIGAKSAPSIVINVNDMAAEMIKIHENLIREDVDAVEEAQYLSEIMGKFKVNQSKLAGMIGRSEAYVTERLRVLTYPANLKSAMQAGDIPYSAARELIKIKDDRVRDEYISHASKSGITPALAKQWAKDANEVPEVSEVEGVVNDSDDTPIPAEFPKNDCFSCKSATDIRELVNVRLCKGCYDQLKQ